MIAQTSNRTTLELKHENTKLLHLIRRASNRTTCDHLFQMLVLRFYDLISSVSMEREITWSTQLSTCHCLHSSSSFHSCSGDSLSTRLRPLGPALTSPSSEQGARSVVGAAAGTTRPTTEPGVVQPVDPQLP